MMQVLSEVEAAHERGRQLVNVAGAIRTVLKLYPKTDPRAVTSALILTGTDFGLLSHDDMDEAIRCAGRNPT